MKRDLDDAAMEATYWREVFNDLGTISGHIGKIAEGLSSAVVSYGLVAVTFAFQASPGQMRMFEEGMDGLVQAMNALAELQTQLGSMSEVAAGRIPTLTQQIDEARGTD